MSISRLLAVAALAAGSPLAAQDGAAQPVDATATASDAPDPERLAMAERVVDRIWPVGTMRRMMGSTMQGAIRPYFGVDEAAADESYIDDKATRRAQHEARTGRPLSGSPLATAGEPAPDPRQAMSEMSAVLGPIFERTEPPLRAAIARIYARRYSVEQLGELEAFFSTPTGAAYAADSLILMSDPELVAAMQGAMGEMFEAVLGGPPGQGDDEAAAAAEAAEAVNAAAAADAGVVKYE